MERRTTCMVYNGWGGAARTDDVVPCNLTEQLDEGRSPGSGLNWTHYIDVDFTVEIRDGVTRNALLNTLLYADGDEVRIPDADGTKYVVVFVTPMAMGTSFSYKRAYLMRDAPVFDGTGY